MDHESEKRKIATIIAGGFSCLVLLLAGSTAWFSQSGATTFDHIPQVVGSLEVYRPTGWYRSVEDNWLPKRFRKKCPRYHKTGCLFIRGDITRQDHLDHIARVETVWSLELEDCQHPETILQHSPAITSLRLVNCRIDHDCLKILSTKPLHRLTLINCHIVDSDPTVSTLLETVPTLHIKDMEINPALCRSFAGVNNLSGTDQMIYWALTNCTIHDEFRVNCQLDPTSFMILSLDDVIISETVVDHLTRRLGPPTEGEENRDQPSHLPRSFRFESM